MDLKNRLGIFVNIYMYPFSWNVPFLKAKKNLCLCTDPGLFGAHGGQFLLEDLPRLGGSELGVVLCQWSSGQGQRSALYCHGLVTDCLKDRRKGISKICMRKREKGNPSCASDCLKERRKDSWERIEKERDPSLVIAW